jgi:endo-beta-N-acetylglucosaminidase D
MVHVPKLTKYYHQVLARKNKIYFQAGNKTRAKHSFLAFEKWKQRRTLGDGEAEQWFVLEHLH